MQKNRMLVKIELVVSKMREFNIFKINNKFFAISCKWTWEWSSAQVHYDSVITPVIKHVEINAGYFYCFT